MKKTAIVVASVAILLGCSKSAGLIEPEIAVLTEQATPKQAVYLSNSDSSYKRVKIYFAYSCGDEGEGGVMWAIRSITFTGGGHERVAFKLDYSDYPRFIPSGYIPLQPDYYGFEMVDTVGLFTRGVCDMYVTFEIFEGSNNPNIHYNLYVSVENENYEMVGGSNGAGIPGSSSDSFPAYIPIPVELPFYGENPYSLPCLITDSSAEEYHIYIMIEEYTTNTSSLQD